MVRSIHSSVGRQGARNLPKDVGTVQILLNKVRHGEGRPVPLLIQDSICGPKTIRAIQRFQAHHFGWSGADGKVAPDGKTLKKLNEYDIALPTQANVLPLTVGSLMLCPHGGQIHGLPSGSIKPGSRNPGGHGDPHKRGAELDPQVRRVLKDLTAATGPGLPVLKANDLFIVVGCVHQGAGGRMIPCVLVRWIGLSEQTLTLRSMGVCYNPNGAPQGMVTIIS